MKRSILRFLILKKTISFKDFCAEMLLKQNKDKLRLMKIFFQDFKPQIKQFNEGNFETFTSQNKI